MIVCLAGKSILFFESLNKNKLALLLDDINFITKDCNEILEKDIDLLICDETIDAQSEIIFLTKEIELPCSIYQLSELIKRKLFLIKSYRLAALIFKPSSFSIFNEDNELILKLTEKESKIIEYLIKNNNGVTESELLNNVWNYSECIETTTVETHMYRLKNKLNAIGLFDVISFSNENYLIRTSHVKH